MTRPSAEVVYAAIEPRRSGRDSSTPLVFVTFHDVADPEHGALGREAPLDQVEIASARPRALARTSARDRARDGAPDARAAASTQVTSAAVHERPRAAEHLGERRLGAGRGQSRSPPATAASRHPAASTKGTGRAFERHQARVAVGNQAVDVFARNRPSKYQLAQGRSNFDAYPVGVRRQPS